MFGKISHTTINGWIDRRGDKPKWSERALKRVEFGNHQSLDNKGGRRGVLVSE